MTGKSLAQHKTTNRSAGGFFVAEVAISILETVAESFIGGYMIIAEDSAERIANDDAEPIMRETMTIIQNGKPVKVYKDDVEKALYSSLYEALRVPFNYGA